MTAATRKGVEPGAPEEDRHPVVSRTAPLLACRARLSPPTAIKARLTTLDEAPSSDRFASRAAREYNSRPAPQSESAMRRQPSRLDRAAPLHKEICAIPMQARPCRPSPIEARSGPPQCPSKRPAI